MQGLKRHVRKDNTNRLRERTTATLLIASFMLSAFTVVQALVGGGDVYIDEYRATFYPNGTLVEEYTYENRVKKFRKLYRRAPHQLGCHKSMIYHSCSVSRLQKRQR